VVGKVNYDEVSLLNNPWKGAVGMTMAKFGPALKKLRKQKRVSAKALAQRMGLKPSSDRMLRLWEEGGERTPLFTSVVAYLDGLDLTLMDLHLATQSESDSRAFDDVLDSLAVADD